MVTANLTAGLGSGTEAESKPLQTQTGSRERKLETGFVLPKPPPVTYFLQ